MTLQIAGRVNKNQYSIEPKFFIKETGGEWVDFSDRTGSNGIDVLRKIGRITNRIEIGFTALSTTIQSITLDNKDGIFNQPFPSTLKTVDGSAASFSNTKGFKRSVLRGLECKVAVRLLVPNALVDTAHIIGPDVQVTGSGLDDMTTGGTYSGTTSDVWTITVDGTGSPDTFKWKKDSGSETTLVVMTGSAQTLQEGVTVTWAATTGHTLNDVFKFSITETAGPVDTVQEFTLGHFFIEGIKPNFGKGTVQLKLISFDGKLQKKQANGIKNGFDFYEQRPASFLIEEILLSEFGDNGSLPSGYNIAKNTFLTPLDGNAVISNVGRPPLWDGTDWRNDGLHTRALAWANIESAGMRLYYGANNELWYYEPSLNQHTKIGDVTSGRNIKKIWYDSILDKLFMFAIEDEYWEVVSEPPDEINRKGWDAKIWKYAPASGLVDTTSTNEIFPFSQMASTTHTGSGNVARIGRNDEDSGSSASHFGENFFIPFAQHVKSPHGTVSTLQQLLGPKSGAAPDDLLTVAVDAKTAFVVADELFMYASRGMCSVGHRAGGGLINYGTLWYIGQQPCIEFSKQQASTPASSSWVYYYKLTGRVPSGSFNVFASTVTEPWATATAVFVELQVQRIDSGTTHNSYALPTTLDHATPLCLAYNKGDTDIYAFFYVQNATGTGSFVKNICKSVRLDTDNASSDPHGTVTDCTSAETGDDQYWTPIAIKFFDTNTDISGDAAVVCMFNRSSGYYVLLHSLIADVRGTTLFSSSTLLRQSTMPFTCFEIDTVDDTILVFAMGEGKIYSVTKAGVATALNEYPAISNEFGILGGLAVDSLHSAGNPDIVGISSPSTHLESFQAVQAGKYSMFRYAKEITDTVEYADFNGLTKWKAVSLLAQARDGLAFYDKEGNFNYLNRVNSSSGNATYKVGGFEHTNYLIDDQSKKLSLELDYGYDKVFNVAKVITYSLNFNPKVTSGLTLIPRTSNNENDKDLSKINFVDFDIEQKDTLKKKVLVFCVTGGKTDDGNSRWKYNIINTEVEAIVRTQTISSATDIPLNSVFGGAAEVNGIHVNDFAVITNPDTNVLIVRGITVVNTSTDTITINSSFGVQVEVGSIITIQRGFQTDSLFTKTQWSDEGVTYVTATGSVSDTVITVKSTENVSIGTVVRFELHPDEYRITAKTDTTITIDRVIGSGGLLSSIAVDEIVFGFYSPEIVDGSEIGDTNIFITWLAGSGAEGTDYTKTFISGDQITITTEGQTLEIAKNSLQVVVNSSSLDKHGKSEFAIDNRFMSRIIAKEIANRIVFYNADPKFQIKITLPLIPYIDIVTDNALTTIDVQDPEAFPLSKNNTERFLIREISHDVNTLTTDLILSGIDSY